MSRQKNKKSWSNYGDGIQAGDITFEVSKLDQIRLSEGKSTEGYKKQHAKTVKLINQFNAELGGRAEMGLSISKARFLTQIGEYRKKEENKQSVIVEG